MMNARNSIGLTTLATLVATLAVGCAAETSTKDDSSQEAVGGAVVSSRTDNDKIVSSISSSKTDDTLTVTFDRAGHTARLTPRFGQSKVVPLDAVPADTNAANKYVSDALTRGTATGQNTRGGIAPKTFEPPPEDCLHTCYGVCDDAFPNACQNAVCRFGCYVGCTSK